MEDYDPVERPRETLRINDSPENSSDEDPIEEEKVDM